MKHFTIDNENNITAHADRQAARETNLGVFSTEEQFTDLIGPDNKRLLNIWNSLPGVKPVTKFTNRKIATERIWRAIQHLGGSTAPQDNHQEPAVPTTPFDETVANVGAQAADVAPVEAKASKKTSRAKKSPKGAGKAKLARQSSKTDQAIAMMRRPGGATLPELMAKFGWLAHTTRGFVSILGSKHGMKVESFKNGVNERCYRIAK
jgi:hypothetical protein